jgi:hypothetical protein
MKYFEVQEELTLHADQWFLRRPRSATGEVLYPDEFTVGVPYIGPVPVTLEIGQNGKEVQFHLAAFGMPVVSHKIANIIRSIAPDHAEFFPVEIVGAENEYEIMNVTCLLDCLDEDASNFTVWKEADGRPDLVGQYQMISQARIDGSRAARHPIFRLSKFCVSLFVTNQIQEELEDRPDLGVKFISAS